jgi:hypothetical protein
MPGPPDPFQRLAELSAALEAERHRCAQVQQPLLAERDAIIRRLAAEPKRPGSSRRQWSLREIAAAAGLRSHRAVQRILERNDQP